MKIDERTKEWFWICIMAACLLVFLYSMGSCMNEHSEARRQYAKDNPVEYAKERCYSKIRGSRPACWTEADWIEFCKRVQCKQR